MISYILFFVILFVFWIATGYIFNKSVARISAPANFFMVFILYFCGLFKRLDAGMYLFFAICLVTVAITVIKVFAEKDAKRLLKTLLDPVAIFFFVAGISFGIVFKEMISYHWDETTHWALVTKNMITYDNFGNLGDSTTMFNRYVPATGLFMYAFQFFGNHEISNGMMYAAFDVLLMSMMLPVTELFKNKLGQKAVFCSAAYLLIPCIFKLTLYCELLVDGLLGVSLAYTFLNYMIDRGKFDNFSWLALILDAFFVIQIKSSGMVMFFFGTAFILLDLITRNRKGILPFLKKKSTIIGLVALVAVIVYAKVSWSVYCNVNDVRAGWNSSELTLPNLWKYFTRPDDFQNQVTYKFVRAFFIGSFYYEYNAYLQVPQLLMFAIAAGLSIAYAKKLNNKAYGIVNAVSMILLITSFAFVTLLIYIFSFSYAESLSINAYARYMTAMNIGIILTLGIQGIDICLREEELSVAYSWKNIGAVASVVLVVATSLTLGFRYYIHDKTVPQKVSYDYYSAWMETTEKLSESDSVYYVMHDYQANNTYVRRYLKVRFFCTPAKCSGFSEGGSYADGRDAPIFLTGNPFSMEFSLEEFTEETAQYRYLWIDKTSKRFNEKYGSLFEGTPTAKVLYERTETDGKVVFKIANI